MKRRFCNWRVALTMAMLCLLGVNGWAQTPDSTDNSNIQHMGNFTPSNIVETVTYNPTTNQYTIVKKVGSLTISTETISADEYQRRKMNQTTADYWRKKENANSQGTETNSLIPKININNEIFKNIFGSSKIEIRPQGTAELILGVRVNKTENPNIPLQQRTVATFNFDQNIQMSLLGKIGDKIQLNANFNTKAVFNFENQMNLKYEGNEDDILQVLEFGNVSLPLTGTLIQGSQALFGVKNKLKFGKLEITSVFTQQQGQKQNIQVQGGAQITKFEVACSNYEANRHYFLSDYFMNQFDASNASLPFVTSPINITRIEVWVTNRVNATENLRNIVGMIPLGEPSFPNTTVFPANEANPTFDPQLLDQNQIRDITSQYLFNQLKPGIQIEKLANARLLAVNEYTFDPILGYISLNQSLNADEVLGVAYQYTVGGQTFQVGEFGTDIPAPKAICVKLLKASNLDVKQANWNWMMKNIYSIGGYNIGQEDFTLNIIYQDTETGLKQNFFPNAGAISGIPLLKIFNLDRLNPQNDQIPDGFFDFVEGRTIRAQNGRIIFPVRQPFSSTYLSTKITDAALVQRYAFDSLYTTIQQLAELNQEKNRFYVAGSYKGAAGNEISLNAFNVPQGSVTVTAGGKTLTEGVDYTVDYSAGKVRIVNESILNSGLPINISLENNATFNIQQKRMIGIHADYKFSKNFQMGATFMNLHERPLTQKIDIGNEPISNTMLGYDINYSTTSNFITRIVDKIPGIDTKVPSNFKVNAEIAGLIPGFNTVIDKTGENGISYVDDFEGAETPIDIRNPFFWRLGTVPQHNPAFPNGDLFNDLRYNYNRAKMAWFIQDPLFYRNNSYTPNAIKNKPSIMINNYCREIDSREVFPGYQPPTNLGVISTQQILDLQFYPNERGPYNYDATSLDASNPKKVQLLNPKSNFSSMMRRMETTNWDAANVAYIEFWMMDPFDPDLDSLKAWDADPGDVHNLNLDPGGGGKFIIQIGNMSEDVCRDGRLGYENGLPTPSQNRPFVNTVWGRAPLLQPINSNFDNDPATRDSQDVGYDGLIDIAEKTHFSSFLGTAQSVFVPNTPAYDNISADPSGDNYKHYTGTAYNNDVLDDQSYPHQRYKNYIGAERNSPAGNINESFQQTPNTEDVNTNFTLDQPEGYYQYTISLKPGDLENTDIGTNYITDVRLGDSKGYPDPSGGPNLIYKHVRWIQFRIPIRSEDREQFGTIDNFRSIRYMRMLMTDFPDDIYVRLATLQLVRADWRIYDNSLWDPTAFVTTEAADFNAVTVNIEENTGKQPFPYAMPPGISREVDPANPQLTQLNEQSLVLNVKDLQDGEAKAVYKNTEYDFRSYKHLKMFVHAEEVQNTQLDSNDLSVFVRLGMDATENYYEVEVPLALSDPTQQPSNKVKPSDDENYRKNVWLQKNEINILLEQLPEVKLARNAAGYPQNLVYETVLANGQRVRIVGNPNIANIRSMMIGVRNPHSKDNPWQTGANGTKQDDGLPKTAQIWVNELRVTDYYETGGWAAKVRTQLDLADFGQITASASYTSAGFGNIDQKPLQRARQSTTTFDITTQFEFGKFFGPKAGITIPVFFSYSTSIANPQFNPLDPDVRFTRALDNLSTDAEKEELRQLTQTVITRTSFNITNMRKNRTGGNKKVHLWDVENLDVSYSYTADTYRDIKTVKNNTTQHKGSLGYTFAPTVKYWEPFKKMKSKSKWLKWLKDFNFTLVPKRLAARANIQRDENEFLLRNTTTYDLLILPSFKKNFIWVRTYDFQYSPFKSVTFTFNATNNSRIDEPEMHLDNTIKPRVGFFGRNTMYTHNYDINYQLPFSKFPITEWISASVGYNGNYKWTSGTMQSTNGVDFTQGRFGNVAQNSTTFKVNVQLNLSSLWTKIPGIKEIWKAPKKDDGKPDTTDPKKFKTVKWTSKKPVNFKKEKKKLIKHNLKTTMVTLRIVDRDGNTVKGKTEVVDEDRVRFIADDDAKGATIFIEGKRPRKKFDWGAIPKTIGKIIFGLKNLSVSYTETNGTVLPGYKAGTSLLGMDVYNSGVGSDFVFGRQYSDVDLLNKVVHDNWLVKDSAMNILFTRTHNDNLTYNATYEPFKGFRVTFTGTRTYSENYQSNYRWVPSLNGGNGEFHAQNPLTVGNFTISSNMMATSFGGIGHNFASTFFAELLAYRSIVSGRIAQLNPNAVYNPNATYQAGYGDRQQDVLMYSFLAAYQGRNPHDMNLDMFPQIPIPNWRIQFDGLKDLPLFKKIFKNIVFTHAYQSTMNMAGFQSNYKYTSDPMYDPTIFINNPFAHSVKDDNQNFISRYFMNSITLMESYNPLIKMDLTFNNTVQASVEIKSSRNISLNFPNSQITESSTFEVIVGAGYTVKNVKLPFRIGGKEIKSNLNLRFDFGMRDNSTVIRKIDTMIEQVTAGQRAINIKAFAEYQVNTSITVRLFVDQIINNPFVANQFPTANTNAGLSIRFTLSQ
jgi:cell surface protein SprA